MTIEISLPGGEGVPGFGPVVILGPNGSGKSRQSRLLNSNSPIEFINALRNTRVAPELQAMGVDTARANFANTREQSKHSHWEISSDFDYMLSQLLAQQSMAAMEFTRRYTTDPTSAGVPELTPLTQIEKLWEDVFPGRKLRWADWKPVVSNTANGSAVEYSANQMSDGEKSVLYLAGRVLTANAGIVVVDEPETHLHTLLAVKLWDTLELARPDVRFVYVTHDLTFAMSRSAASFVLASPLAGLRLVATRDELPEDVAETLLGSASLSFHASRVVFCEGDEKSLDSRLYNSWFNGADTVVRSVGSCQRVMRCVDALASSGIANSLTAVGIVDRDYHPENFITSLPAEVKALEGHEIESVLSHHEIVSAVCRHLKQPFDVDSYQKDLIASVSSDQVRQITIDRWKRKLEPLLESLVSGVGRKSGTIQEITLDIPNLFNHQNWSFSATDLLEEERVRVEESLLSGNENKFFKIIPGKQLLALAARHSGMTIPAYVNLIFAELFSTHETLLQQELSGFLEKILPARYVRTLA